MKNLSALLATCTLISLLTACNSGEKTETAQSTDTTEIATTPATETAASQELCFLQVTEGQPITVDGKSQPVVDSLIVRLTINGNAVTGVYNWLPSMKDKMTGTLEGTRQGNEITTIYTYAAEGTTAKEEKVFKLEADKLLVKSGELEEKNGVWTLKTKETAPYSQSLPKVACR